MANRFRLGGDPGFKMSNRLTTTVLDMLARSRIDGADDPEFAPLLAFLADRAELNQVAYGTVGFDLGELPWIASAFDEQVAFLQRVIDDARVRVLDTWLKPEVGYRCLDGFDRLLTMITADDILPTPELAFPDRSAQVRAYYERGEEHDRLSAGTGRVEFARTVEVIGRTLPAPPAVVADIGGGPGAYTGWLVEAGYSVIHRDLMRGHVEQVEADYGDAVDTAVGDARELDLDDASVDAVLLLGPLYHLERSLDRRQVLVEAARVVRPDGWIYAAAISRWAVRLDGIIAKRIHVDYPEALDVVERVEATGIIPPLIDGDFNGYGHTPEELGNEIRDVGLRLESLVALEGLSFALADLDERLDDPVERAVLLDQLRATESEPSLLGIGPHLLATIRPPAPVPAG